MVQPPKFSDTLEQDTLAAIWRQQAWPDVFDPPQFHLYDCLDSTNQAAWSIPRATVAPQVVLARQQTAGRGQWGRTWDSPSGGLYLSLWLPESPIPVLMLTLVTAWGIATSLRQHQIPVWLKWPNDLLVQGQKLGGIKVEQRTKQSAVVIGVGINGSNPTPPQGIGIPDCSQQTIGSLTTLAAVVSRSILTALVSYATLKPSGFLAQYWELLETKQRLVKVAGGQGEIIGITHQGQLKVRLMAPGASTQLCCDPGEVEIGYPAIAANQPSSSP